MVISKVHKKGLNIRMCLRGGDKHVIKRSKKKDSKFSVLDTQERGKTGSNQFKIGLGWGARVQKRNHVSQ